MTLVLAAHLAPHAIQDCTAKIIDDRRVTPTKHLQVGSRSCPPFGSRSAVVSALGLLENALDHQLPLNLEANAAAWVLGLVLATLARYYLVAVPPARWVMHRYCARMGTAS